MILSQLYILALKIKRKKPKLTAGDYVGISIYKQSFEKGYIPSW